MSICAQNGPRSMAVSRKYPFLSPKSRCSEWWPAPSLTISARRNRRVSPAVLNQPPPRLRMQVRCPRVWVKEAATLFARCYPLSPAAALVLPLLCQKVAQNERTLFSYLGSHEEHGLQDVLSRFESVDDWVQLHHVFDYFVANQAASLGTRVYIAAGPRCYSTRSSRRRARCNLRAA